MLSFFAHPVAPDDLSFFVHPMKKCPAASGHREGGLLPPMPAAGLVGPADESPTLR